MSDKVIGGNYQKNGLLWKFKQKYLKKLFAEKLVIKKMNVVYLFVLWWKSGRQFIMLKIEKVVLWLIDTKIDCVNLFIGMETKLRKSIAKWISLSSRPSMGKSRAPLRHYMKLSHQKHFQVVQHRYFGLLLS